MARLHIFNPDTDFALAAKSDFYTPPASVASLRREFALTPALYADPGDAILLLDNLTADEIAALPHYSHAVRKNLTLVRLPGKGEAPNRRFEGYVADPWGWNSSLRRLLMNRFSGIRGIPSEEMLTNIRRLFHRRITIDFLKPLIEEENEKAGCGAEILSESLRLPQEIFSVEEALELYFNSDDLFFKAPWSSSGRGIIRTNDLEERHVRPWIEGIIAAQGSVIAETAYDKLLDFATEWKCLQGKVTFSGFSLFETSRRGKFKGVFHLDSQEIARRISEASFKPIEETVEYQRRQICRLIAPFYDGPLGVDSLVTKSGMINPCVEINLRRTMGMIPLEYR